MCSPAANREVGRGDAEAGGEQQQHMRSSAAGPPVSQGETASKDGLTGSMPADGTAPPRLSLRERMRLFKEGK